MDEEDFAEVFFFFFFSVVVYWNVWDRFVSIGLFLGYVRFDCFV